jgi:hypothetical protein
MVKTQGELHAKWCSAHACGGSHAACGIPQAAVSGAANLAAYRPPALARFLLRLG